MRGYLGLGSTLLLLLQTPVTWASSGCRVQATTLSTASAAFTAGANAARQAAEACGRGELARQFYLAGAYVGEIRARTAPLAEGYVLSSSEVRDARYFLNRAEWAFYDMEFPHTAPCHDALLRTAGNLYDGAFVTLLYSVSKNPIHTLLGCTAERPFCNGTSFLDEAEEADGTAPFCTERT